MGARGVSLGANGLCVILYLAWTALLGGASDRPVREINDERTERTKWTQEKLEPSFGILPTRFGAR
ncbi:hypothetical protein [Kamptonema formosum]|uniref:hypothetical protein n=1 Tax=Kamptonema formosum TaxID=331992 RepID=UPI00034B3EED|nr:hypothetical protein [Kamptonema formosum]